MATAIVRYVLKSHTAGATIVLFQDIEDRSAVATAGLNLRELAGDRALREHRI